MLSISYLLSHLILSSNDKPIYITILQMKILMHGEINHPAMDHTANK